MDPISFNEKKRNLLGNEVHESFLHPKMFKTNTINLKNESSNFTPKKRKTETPKSSASVPKKHKFQLI